MTNKIHYNNAHRLIRFLDKNKKKVSPLLILMHNYPDPDALASAYALKYLCEKAFGIRSRIVYKGVIGRIENINMVTILKLPIHKLKKNEINKYAHVALVDTQPNFENNPFPDSKKATLVIDQHPTLKNKTWQSDLLIVDVTCGATCVILAQAILALKLPIPERLATSIAYGISSDTLNLYRASRLDVGLTYLKILPFSNMRLLARIQIPVYNKEYFSILDKGIRTTRISQGLVLCHLGKVDCPDVVSQVADFLLSYKYAKWVLTTGRFKKRLHASLRTTKMNYPAATLLRKCFKNPQDAGGHGKIAGGSLEIIPTSDRKFRQEEKQLESNMFRQLALRAPKVFSRIYE